MGALESITAKTREATFNHSIRKDKYCDHGRPFIGMLEDHHLYGEWLDVETEYEIKLVKSTLHCYLLVKKKGAQALPYVSFEITTSNMTNLIPVTRNYDVCKDNATDMGVFKGRLSKLCSLADEVVSEMDTYNLFTRNCLNFCNELLKKVGKNESPTTFSPDTNVENYDRTISRDFDLSYKASGGKLATNLHSCPILSIIIKAYVIICLRNTSNSLQDHGNNWKTLLSSVKLLCKLLFN